MQDRTVVVTGASGGFGMVTCKQLLDQGYMVFALDIKHGDWSGYSQMPLIPIQMDLGDIASIENAVEEIKTQCSQLHGLINIAGTFDQFSLAEVSPERFSKLMSTNFIGHQHLTSLLFPLLYKAKGRIVNLSSETVLAPMPLQAYGFSKGVFEVWSDQLRMELGLLGMKVIKIRAGGHVTPFIKRSVEALSEINQDSVYSSLMEKIKVTGVQILNSVNNDPKDVATIIVGALEKRKPSKVYHVNLSLLFRLLSILPSGIREKILISKLKTWM